MKLLPQSPYIEPKKFSIPKFPYPILAPGNFGQEIQEDYKNYQLQSIHSPNSNINLTKFPENGISFHDFKKVYDNFFKLHISIHLKQGEGGPKNALSDYIAAVATLNNYKKDANIDKNSIENYQNEITNQMLTAIKESIESLLAIKDKPDLEKIYGEKFTNLGKENQDIVTKNEPEKINKFILSLISLADILIALNPQDTLNTKIFENESINNLRGENKDELRKITQNNIIYLLNEIRPRVFDYDNTDSMRSYLDDHLNLNQHFNDVEYEKLTEMSNSNYIYLPRQQNFY